jgi:ribosomal protein L29
MPYKLRKAPKRELYWVITIETGKKHSKDPIPKEKAKAQMRILESALKGGMMRNPLAAASRDQDAKKVIQRILNAANSARAMSITMAEGHKSMEKIMNEAALELAKSGNSAAVEYLNDLRAPYEQDADYTADDSTSRNKIAKQMGLEVKSTGGRNLRGGITLNEFDDLLQAYARKYSDYDDIKEKTEEDLQKMLKYTKKFFNILKSNLNTNQWNNPRLMQLIDSLDSLEKDQLRKLKNGEELKLDENGKYTEIVDLIHNTKMDDEKETDILANSSEHVGNPTRNPPKEFPPVPVKRLSKGDGKNYCKKCGLPRR